jgi:hypothetical protein
VPVERRRQLREIDLGALRLRADDANVARIYEGFSASVIYGLERAIMPYLTIGEPY